ncbi:MAG: hypothetical protein U1F77_20460 [Kiritimatiellia bacterium]
MKLKNMFVISSSAALCMVVSQSCATQRNLIVLRNNGMPAANVLVVYREANISIYNRVGAGYTGNNGVYTFKSKNQTWVEAFDATNSWGRLSLGNKVSGVLHLDNPEYIGSVADYFLSRQAGNESTIAMQLKDFLDSRKNGADGGRPPGFAEPPTPKP